MRVSTVDQHLNILNGKFLEENFCLKDLAAFCKIGNSVCLLPADKSFQMK